MSSLRLDRHFFTRIDLRPNPEGKPEGKVKLDWSLTVAQAAEDPTRHQVTLAVILGQDPNTPEKVFYTGTFEIVGFFTVAKECPKNPDLMVRVSGASLLYGAIREMVCNLTARGPWPVVCLPTVNFTPQPGDQKSNALPPAPTVPAIEKT